MAPTVASLCSGYGGLDLAVDAVLGPTRVAWFAEIEPRAAAVFTAHHPDAPNLGDLTAITSPPPVDVLTGGFPCQPVSSAGARKGTDDHRWLFDDICTLVGRMDPRPRLLIFENVRGLLTANDGDAMARVVQGLARLGYVGSWRTVRASDVGACHQRARIFIVAHAMRDGWLTAADWRSTANPARTSARPANSARDVAHPHGTRSQGPEPAGRRDLPPWRGGALADADGAPGRTAWSASEAVHEPGTVERSGRRGGVDDGGALNAQDRPTKDVRSVRRADGAQALRDPIGGPDPLSNAQDMRSELREHEARPALPRRAPSSSATTPGIEVLGLWDDEQSARSPHRPEHHEQRPGQPHDAVRFVSPEAALAGGPHATCCSQAWGQFAPAVARWATIVGRCAPSPVDDRRRLSPLAVEWMMGLPAGWVTDVEPNRSHALRILGNGVVPQQAAYALRLLHLGQLAAIQRGGVGVTDEAAADIGEQVVQRSRELFTSSGTVGASPSMPRRGDDRRRW